MAAASEPPWEKLRGNLRAFIGRRVRNPSDVDDLLQRVLLQIVKGLGSLRDAERLHAWVYRTGRNVIADYYRTPSARREVPSSGAEDMASADSPAATSEEDEGAALQELAACMAPMLRRLPPAYREAVTLADLDGVNQMEAAKRVGVSLSGMKSRVQRGRKQLRAVLEDCCRIELDRRRHRGVRSPRTKLLRSVWGLRLTPRSGALRAVASTPLVNSSRAELWSRTAA